MKNTFRAFTRFYTGNLTFLSLCSLEYKNGHDNTLSYLAWHASGSSNSAGIHRTHFTWSFPASAPPLHIRSDKLTPHLFCFLLTSVLGHFHKNPRVFFGQTPAGFVFLSCPKFGGTTDDSSMLWHFLKDALAPPRRRRRVWNTRQASQVPTVLFKEYTPFYSTYISFSTARMETHAGFLHP